LQQTISEYLGMKLVGPEQLIIPILTDLYQWGKAYVQRLRKPGMYEVLNYESTLEILDDEGREGRFSKMEKVRFLKDNVIAIQDQVWGINNLISDYICSPGLPVDFYQSGHKTYVIISLREIKSKDDIEIFNFQWKLEGKPVRKYGYWETFINRSTKNLKVMIIYPKNRPPIRVWVIEQNRKKTIELDEKNLTQLPDKRWKIVWEKKNPSLYENHTIKWEW